MYHSLYELWCIVGDICILTRLLRKQTEEADEAKRAEKQKKSEEHRVQQKVAAAVSDAKVCGTYAFVIHASM